MAGEDDLVSACLCFQNFLNFLAANGFSIGGKHGHPLLAIKAIIRQIGCKVTFITRSRLDRGTNHRLDSQSPQVCSPCLTELGAVYARLVFQTANNPKRSDAVQGGHSDRARSSTSTRPGGRRVSNVGTVGEWLGRRVWHQHLAEMLQHTSDTRTSREMSISTKMSSPDDSPVRVQALKWSRVLWPYKLAISNWFSHDHDEAVTSLAATIPTNQRFAAWSFQYLLVLGVVDALIGGIAGGVPAFMSDTLYFYQAVPLICLVGLLFWPAAIALSRGYRRARIDVGSSEFRAVMLGGTLLIMAAALPAGFLTVPNEGLDHSQVPGSPLLLLKVAVVAAPIAILPEFDCSTICPEVSAPDAEERAEYPARDCGGKLCSGSAADRSDSAGAAQRN